MAEQKRHHSMMPENVQTVAKRRSIVKRNLGMVFTSCLTFSRRMAKIAQEVKDNEEDGQGMSNYLKFLGTAGARFVMIQQLRSSAGTVIHLDGQTILLDPGPGTLARCAASRPKINPAELQAIILSHRHVDHSTDVNVMMEAMSEGGFKKRGVLYAPEDCLEGADPVVLRYVRDYIAKIETLHEKSVYNVNGLRFRTSGRHRHGTETYGLIFESSLGKISFLVDTEFMPELAKWYKGARVLVLNVVRLKPADDDRVIQHLCLPEAQQIISEIKPEVAILTHFGSTMLRAKPWELVEKMSRETGVKVIAAADGMNFALEE